MQVRRRRRPLRPALPPSQQAPRSMVYPVAILLAAGAAAFGLWAYTAYAPAPLPETVALTIGTAELAVAADAMVMRAESLQTAPVSGQVRRLAQEGKRVRPGTPVALITPDGGGPPVEVLAAMSGIVEYRVDGLEDLLARGEAAGWQPSWFRSLPLSGPRQTATGRVSAGDALFRQVEPTGQSLLVIVDRAAAPPLSEGSEIELRTVGGSGVPVQARIDRLHGDDTAWLLSLTAPQWPAELADVRRARLSVVFERLSGKAVPPSAIDVRQGRQGVWIVQHGTVRFVPARVIGGNAVTAIIESDLGPGTQVVKHAPRHPEP